MSINQRQQTLNDRENNFTFQSLTTPDDDGSLARFRENINIPLSQQSFYWQKQPKLGARAKTAEKLPNVVQITSRNKFELNQVIDKYQEQRFNDYVEDLKGTKVSYDVIFRSRKKCSATRAHNESTFTKFSQFGAESTYRRGSQETIPTTERLNLSFRAPSIQQNAIIDSRNAQFLVKKLTLTHNRNDNNLESTIKDSFLSKNTHKKSIFDKSAKRQSILHNAIEIDPIDSELCDYSLKYKQLSITKRNSQIKRTTIEQIQVQSPMQPKEQNFEQKDEETPQNNITVKPKFVRKYETNNYIEEQNIVQFLDQQIQRRKNQLIVQISSEACQQKQIYQNFPGVTEYQQDVKNFIEKRLKLKYRTQNLSQKLSGTQQNCCIQNRNSIQQFKFNKIQDIEHNLKKPLKKEPKIIKLPSKRRASIIAEPKPQPFTECTHTQTSEDIRLREYQQYSRLIKFISNYETLFQQIPDKQQIIQKISEGEFYNMQNLTNEEMQLFENREKCLQILMNPLLYLTKGENQNQDDGIIKEVAEGFQIDKKAKEYVQNVYQVKTMEKLRIQHKEETIWKNEEIKIRKDEEKEGFKPQINQKQFLQQVKSLLERFLDENYFGHDEIDSPSIFPDSSQISKKRKLFDRQVQEQNFYDFAKIYQNDITSNDQEITMQKMLKEFTGEKPTPIFTKINHDELILENEHLSELQAKILGKYLQWDKSEIKTLKIIGNYSQKQIQNVMNGIGEKIEKVVISVPIIDVDIIQVIQKPKMKELVFDKIQRMLKVDEIFQSIGYIERLTFSNSNILARSMRAQKILDFISDSNLQHLNLAYSSLNSCQILNSLKNNTKLQFINLQGNKVKNYELFESSLVSLFQENTRNLTHLNLSETLTKPINLDLIFDTICQFSRTLQVFHLDNNNISFAQKLEYMQKFGHSTFFPNPCIFDQDHLSLSQKNEIKFIKKCKFVDQIFDPIQNEILKTIPVIKPQENDFTITRNLNSQDIKYNYGKAFIDENQSDSIFKIGEQCHFCSNLQDVHIYFNLKDYAEITNDAVLKKWFPLDKPAIFGSGTDWKVFDLIPIQLYTLSLLRESIVKPQKWLNTDFQFNGNYMEYLKEMFQNRNDEEIRKVMPDYMDYLAYHSNRSLNSHSFFKPSGEPISYLAQLRIPLGRHSFIVFYEGKYYYRQLLISQQLPETYPTIQKKQQTYQQMNYNLFASFAVSKQIFVKQKFNQVAKIHQSLSLMSKLDKILDLFIHLASFDSKLYPNISSQEVHKYTGVNVKDKKIISVQEFVKLMAKLMQKGKEIEQFFTYKKYTLDVYTREYLKQNLKVFQEVFEKKSRQGYMDFENMGQYIEEKDFLKLKASVGYNHERFFEINFDEFLQILILDTLIRNTPTNDFWLFLHENLEQKIEGLTPVDTDKIKQILDI